MSEVLNVEAIFGENVFNLGTMRERLPKNVYKEVKKVMDQGGAALRGHCGEGHEGLGCRTRRDPLYPLVPAADRHYG